MFDTTFANFDTPQEWQARFYIMGWSFVCSLSRNREQISILINLGMLLQRTLYWKDIHRKQLFFSFHFSSADTLCNETASSFFQLLCVACSSLLAQPMMLTVVPNAILINLSAPSGQSHNASSSASMETLCIGCKRPVLQACTVPFKRLLKPRCSGDRGNGRTEVDDVVTNYVVFFLILHPTDSLLHPWLPHPVSHLVRPSEQKAFSRASGGG